MHINGKKTASADLTAIIEGLLKAGVKFILVGGLAAVVQGAPVTTMDVDEETLRQLQENSGIDSQ